jgi:hypothetical protein
MDIQFQWRLSLFLQKAVIKLDHLTYRLQRSALERIQFCSECGEPLVDFDSRWLDMYSPRAVSYCSEACRTASIVS